MKFVIKILYPLPEQRKSPMQRATFEYLRGKVLDVFPDYRKDAEDHLSKAVSKIEVVSFCDLVCLSIDD